MMMKRREAKKAAGRSVPVPGREMEPTLSSPRQQSAPLPAPAPAALPAEPPSLPSPVPLRQTPPATPLPTATATATTTATTTTTAPGPHHHLHHPGHHRSPPASTTLPSPSAPPTGGTPASSLPHPPAPWRAVGRPLPTREEEGLVPRTAPPPVISPVPWKPSTLTSAGCEWMKREAV